MANPFDRSFEIPVRLAPIDEGVEIPNQQPLSAIPTERLRAFERLYKVCKKAVLDKPHWFEAMTSISAAFEVYRKEWDPEI
jgi:hypothetical protein